MRVNEAMKVFVISAAVFISVPALAKPLNLFNMMRDAPITRFAKADTDLMTKTVYRTLDIGEDGSTVNWENPGTPNSGSVTPGKDPQGRAGCRLARIENRHGSLLGAGDYIFCRNGANKRPPWLLIGPSASN